MISIFKRFFDWVQSGPVDFNVVTGEWSFRKETAIGKHRPPPITKWKRLRMRIAWKKGSLESVDQEAIDSYLGINKEEERHPGTFKRH
jgi:hypothetical protein